MKPRVYIETTVPSYLTARPSGDLIRAAQQRQTALWWERRGEYELLGSALLILECGRGDPVAAAARLAVIRELITLERDAQVDALADAIIVAASFPPNAADDATHIALATVHQADYLVTWNIRHVANPVLLRRVYAVCRDQGHVAPVICTPGELLMEVTDDG